ncbi:DoxX family protein [Chryseolinea lacunae]|uniref:DoxX family protein n=1 Tax=Chryseolinea lacunae TaxID=2801331 RepID=A0ABS1L325_9BACT|nr:DoxX family protein [Chryseolinea lacunae]MBL0744951.1 DoxX family protein [Chryseolinea lacunae]
MKIVNIFYWGARVVAALIMLQTLFFKFSASAESVYIFTTVGMEPWGRIAVGVFELIAAVLLLVPATAWLGAGLGLGLMIGALGMHFTLLGIEVQGDHGYLFTLSLIVAVCSAFVLQHDKTKVFALLKSFQKS